jgi:hypothetical protein
VTGRALGTSREAILVVDMVEQGLNQVTQEALERGVIGGIGIPESGMM